MPRTLSVFVALIIACPCCAEELPPYSPPIGDARMSSFVSADLGFAIRYPAEFKPGTPQDLSVVMDRGHRAAYGDPPESDPEHLEAVKCMRPLLYATSQTVRPAQSKSASDDLSPDTILVVDVDKICVPKKIKGDKALSQLAATLLSLPGMKPLVQQMWFQGGGGRKIHSGMAGGMISIPAAPSTPARDAPEYIAAAAFEQKDHWILVAYLNGTRDDGTHSAFPYTAVSFEDGRPVLLFPFLLTKINLVK